MIMHSLLLLLSLAFATQDAQDHRAAQTGRTWQAGARRADESAPASRPAPAVAAKEQPASRPAEAAVARKKNAAPPAAAPRAQSGRSLAYGARRPPAEREPLAGEAREASTPRTESRPAPAPRQSGRSFK